MNTDPQLLVRHAVLLPPSFAAAAQKSTPKLPQNAETWQARQARFRRFGVGVGAAMLLLLTAAFVVQRRAEAPVQPAPAAQRLSASAGKSIPVSTANSISRKLHSATSASRSATESPKPTAVASPPLQVVSARPVPEKIAASESGTKAERLGVSKPQSPSVSQSAFDAPFVPPAD